jgi:putative redox protein
MTVARVTFVGGMRFVATADSGHAVVMDASPESGGANTAPRPMELLLMALGGCTGMDVISILRKKQQDVASLEVVVRGTQAAEYPKRYTDVTVEFVVSGRGLGEEAVRRAVDLSMEKYCSVKATIELETKVGVAITVRQTA